MVTVVFYAGWIRLLLALAIFLPVLMKLCVTVGNCKSLECSELIENFILELTHLKGAAKKKSNTSA